MSLPATIRNLRDRSARCWCLISAYLLLSAVSCFCEDTAGRDAAAKAGAGRPVDLSVTRGERMGVGVGLGMFYSSEPYAGFDNEVTIFPMITYFGERFYWVGPRVGYKLYRSDDVSAGIRLNYDFSGYSGEDSPALGGMSDRLGTVEAGLKFDYRFKRRYVVSADFGFDVLGRHEGFSGALRFERLWFLKKGFIIAPGIGVQWYSADQADYYFGVLPDEARAGRPEYMPGGAVNFESSLRVIRPFGKRGMLVFMPRLEFIGDKIHDSPIVSERLLLTGIFGCSWSF